MVKKNIYTHTYFLIFFRHTGVTLVNLLLNLLLHKWRPHSVFQIWDSCLFFKPVQHSVCVCVCVCVQVRRCDCSKKKLPKYPSRLQPERHKNSTPRPLQRDVLVQVIIHHQAAIKRDWTEQWQWQNYLETAALCVPNKWATKEMKRAFFSLNSIALYHHCNRKKGLLLPGSWLLSFTITGKMLLSQSTHDCDSEKKKKKTSPWWFQVHSLWKKYCKTSAGERNPVFEIGGKKLISSTVLLIEKYHSLERLPRSQRDRVSAKTHSKPNGLGSLVPVITQETDWR